MMHVTDEQIMAVLRSRATIEPLIAEIVRAAIIEASAVVLTERVEQLEKEET